MGDNTMMMMFQMMNSLTSTISSTLGAFSSTGTTTTTGTSSSSGVSADIAAAEAELAQINNDLRFDAMEDSWLSNDAERAALARRTELQAEISRAAQVQESETAISSIVDSVVGIVTLLDELGVINLPETRNGTTASTWLTAIGDALTETGFSIYRAWGGNGSGDDSEEAEATNTKNPRDVKYSEISGTNSYGINQNAWNAAGLDPAAFASFDTDGSGYVSYMEYVQGGGKR